MKTIAKYANLLKASGLTQKELAHEMGISTRTFSKWTHGNAEPAGARTKAALAAAFAKYPNPRLAAAFDRHTSPRAPRPIPPADEEATESEIDVVPDFDPDQLRRVQKASGLTVPEFIQKLGIATMSQYYRYTSGQQARKRSLRKALYDACQTADKLPESLRFERAPEGETEPQPRSRGRSIVSEDLIKDFVERFERESLVDYEQELLQKIIRAVAQEDGAVPRKVREQTAKVIGAALGRIPLDKLYPLLIGVDP